MKTPTLKVIGYAPTSVPSGDLSRWIQDELQRVSAAISALAEGHIEMTYAAPARPRDGDIRLADGTTWNPGSGKGIYAYYNSVWNKL